jgi:2-desacetyl-2-hydroxyethyl bacteriochlorophyllide A dehydrogenase
MKAIQFYKFGKPDVLLYEECEKPKITSKQVLVKVHAAGINPRECMVRKGKQTWISGSKFPQKLGHDLAGEIIEIGQNVKDLKVGDSVFGMLNVWKSGTYAEFVAAKSSEVVPIPENISFEAAAAVPLAALTALQALRNCGKIKQGDVVCINGASGGVGVFAIQLAKIFGAKVIAVTSYRNIALCQELGADEVLDYTKQNILDTSHRFDVFFDAFGNQNFIEIKQILSKNGVYVNTLPRKKIILQQLSTLFSNQKCKMVVVLSKNKDLYFLKKQLETGKLKSVIDKVFLIENAAEAHEYLETKRASGKVVLKVI